MDKKIGKYYHKAQKLIDETDGALLVYVENEGNHKTVSTLVNEPSSVGEVVQMFRSTFLACKQVLEMMDDENVHTFGAEHVLMAAVLMGEPKEMHKSIVVPPGKYKK